MVHIIEDSTDLTFICETWLKDDDTDITNFLESSGFKFYGHNTFDRPGGGLGILYRDTNKCTPEKQDSLISFDYSIWKIEGDNSISFLCRRDFQNTILFNASCNISNLLR